MIGKHETLPASDHNSSVAVPGAGGGITGRVFVALSKTEAPEPIQQIGSWTGQPCRLREWIGKAVSTSSRFERYRNVVNTVYWPASREGKVLYERAA